MELEETLAPLKDIEGVHGSFLFSRRGSLLARDLPSVFGNDVLSEAALRTMRLWETLGEVDRTIESCVIRYQEHKLYVRPVLQGLLCVLTPPGVNMAALRMAVNLVTKRLNRVLADFDFPAFEATHGANGSSKSPVSTRSPALSLPDDRSRSIPNPPLPPTGVSVPPATSSRRQIMYRGRRSDG